MADSTLAQHVKALGPIHTEERERERRERRGKGRERTNKKMQTLRTVFTFLVFEKTILLSSQSSLLEGLGHQLFTCS